MTKINQCKSLKQLFKEFSFSAGLYVKSTPILSEKQFIGLLERWFTEKLAESGTHTEQQEDLLKQLLEEVM